MASACRWTNASQQPSWWSELRCWVLIWLCGGFFLAADSGLAPSSIDAQTPPENLPQVLDSSLKPDAFYFLDAQGNRTMMPGMSFEEIDRLRRGENGSAQPSKPYVIENVAIEGSADDEKAELEITVKLNVAATGGRWVEIPLRMEGFHQRGPADVVGADDSKVETTSTGGVLLWVKVEKQRSIELRMRTVCRVLVASGSGLEFQLPAAPTKVDLSVRGEDLNASIIGRGDEVVRTSSPNPGETLVTVDSSGGTFVLSWRMRDGSRESDQVLEVDSRIRVSWGDAQASPLVTVDLDVNNRRGGLGAFEIVVPAMAELVEPMQNSPTAQLSGLDPKTGRMRVVPSEAEPTSRVKLTLEYRLPAGDFGESLPLILRPIEVPGAVRQSGEIEIRIDRNYRLRWRQQTNVRTVWRTGSGDVTEARVYAFQFDRVDFELPVWLSAKQQRLRIEPEYKIEIGRSTATLEARIVAVGAVIEGVPLVVSGAGWRTVSVDDLETGRSVDDPLGDDGEGLELELGELTRSANASVGVLWKAVRTLDKDRELDKPANDRPVRFELPTIGLADDRGVIVSQGTLTIRPESGYALVTDVEASLGLSRLPTDAINEMASEPVGSSQREIAEGGQRFRIQKVEQPAVYQGYMLERVAEATVDSRLDIDFAADVFSIGFEWILTPRGSFKGQLPVMFGGAGELLDNQWRVRVDGAPALLRLDSDQPQPGSKRWTLLSDRLTSQPCQIRFEMMVPVEDFGTSLKLRMPFPNSTAIKFDRSTDIAVSIPEELQLLVNGTPIDEKIGTNGRRLTELKLSTDAVLPLILQRRPVTNNRRQFVESVVMRTEVARNRRFDRLLARVSGNDTSIRFILNTPAVRMDRLIRVWVDETEVIAFQQESSAVTIPLTPGDSSTDKQSLVDIQIWSERGRDGLTTALRPALQIPALTGKVYWDVVFASDRHLIWNSSGTNESMVWRYDQFPMKRKPILSYADLCKLLGTTTAVTSSADSPTGNRYLLATSDPNSMKIIETSRSIIWLVAGGVVLALSSLVFYIPVCRSPIFVFFIGFAVSGLAWLVPNLAIIAGQLVIAGLLLFAILLGTRTMLMRRTRPTVLGGLPEGSSIHGSRDRRIGSTNDITAPLPETVSGGSAAGAQS